MTITRYFSRLSTAARCCSRRGIASQSFVVKKMTTPEQVRDIIFARAAKEGWRPGALDHISFFSADSNRFFVGELNGEPITSMFFTKYSKDYVYTGGYLVDKKHRGKGYAVRTWNVAYASIDDSCNLAFDSVLERVPFLASHGMLPQWCIQCFDIPLTETSKYLAKESHLKGTEIVRPSKEIFRALLDYDTQVHVVARQSFLENWVFAPNCHCSVAVDSGGKVVGYGVVRTTLGEGSGWRIGPLFADSSVIARSLYRDMCVQVARDDPQAVVTADVSYGRYFSPDTLELLAELNGKATFQMMRVYKYGVPRNMPLHKVFVMT